jgi:16S rRNA (cytosine1402-N4)-methyltransferase
MNTFNHTTVLLRETIDALEIKPDGLYVDCTTGGGGHSAAIAERLTTGRLICFDVDDSAIRAARERLSGFGNIEFIKANFSQMPEFAVSGVSGIVMDLGVSSHQLDTAERGFSFHEDAPLSGAMRMSNEGISAYDLVNDYSADDLTRIISRFGEEKHARSIARGIAAARPLNTTGELAEVIRTSVPISYRNEKNPCRKTFQAIRMEVNHELWHLQHGLNAGFAALKAGGRLAVITFHSLEDRMVKQTFAAFAAGCDCPRELPLCVCGKEPQAVLVNRKPIIPDDAEITANRRARSAKLRVIEKL